jgi:uncharacterized membrane protein
MTKTLRILSLMAAAVMLSFTGAAYAQQIISIDAPNARSTIPFVINNQGLVIGSVVNDDYVQLGFLRKKDGSFVSFNAGSTRTVFTAINSKGQIVGYYESEDIDNSGERPLQGFLLQPDGKMILLEIEGHSALPVGINDAGLIVGHYIGGPYRCCSHVFVRKPNGTITILKPPNFPGSAFAVGINSAGQVVGTYGKHGRSGLIGFVSEPNGTITSFDPVGSTNTSPKAINASGQVVGWYFDDNKKVWYGFLRHRDGTIISLELGEPTCPYSINAAGYIVGYYSNENGSHGFLRKPDGSITTIDVGRVETALFSINSAGDIVGEYIDDGSRHGFLWRK